MGVDRGRLSPQQAMCATGRDAGSDSCFLLWARRPGHAESAHPFFYGNDVVTQKFHTLGYLRMIEAINAGENVPRLLLRLFKDKRKPVGAALLSGALCGLLATYSAARSAGYKAVCTDPAIKEFMSGSDDRISFDLTQALNTSDLELQSAAGEYLIALSLFCAGLKGKVSVTPVQAQVAPAAAPIAVQIVGMPERVTETQVSRDTSTQEIVSTLNIQRDRHAVSAASDAARARLTTQTGSLL